MTHYWNVELGTNVEDHTFTLTLHLPYLRMPHLQDGDILCLTRQNNPVEVARVARCRIGLHETEILLDRRSPMQHDWATVWSACHKDAAPSVDPIAEPEPDLPSYSFFATDIPNVLKDAISTPFAEQKEDSVKRHIRHMMVAAFEDELLGPAEGPNECVCDTLVTERYLVGCLPPRNSYVDPAAADNETPVENDPEASTSGADDGEDAPPAKQTLLPSSIGLSFMVAEGVDFLRVTAEWGRYAKSTMEAPPPQPDRPSHAPKSGPEPQPADGDPAKPRKIDLYKRTPYEGVQLIGLAPGKASYVLDPQDPEVKLEVIVRHLKGTCMVTAFLVNRTEYTGKAKKPPVDKWVFQPSISFEDPDGRGVFIGRDQKDRLLEDKDDELKALDVLYRRRVEFATGHAASVHAVADATDPARAVRIETRLIPKYEVAATETPGADSSDRPAMRKLVLSKSLDMVRLADLSVTEKRDELVRTLKILADDYAAWINELEEIVKREPEIEDSARMMIIKCESARDRLFEGIEVLAKDDLALKAFRFANLAMARQRVRSIFMQKHPAGPNLDADIDVETAALMSQAANHSWRPFQLAFFLLLIPCLADPTHEHRTEEFGTADLLWFPTGGGKTEAYLGAAAFAMAARRLQPSLGGYDSSRGLSVIMRYTLRLLTMQQFQRASTLICAMETLRAEDPGTWGSTPFTIGLWVGSTVTPNKTKDAARHVTDARNFKSTRRFNAEDPAFQVARCPWCGTPLTIGQNIQVSEDELKTHIYCPNVDCHFSKAQNIDGLPLLAVDEEIYRRPPSMLIATVDKFAQMPLNGAVRALFGLASKECPRHGLILPDCCCGKSHTQTKALPAVTTQSINPIRPPDLIIQDEFHLISGPLGTMVGLYETAIDDLCSWRCTKDGQELRIRPKVVASTATVRRAGRQMLGVFYRKTEIFPPSGLNIEDNFFSVQRPLEQKPGRLYLGVCSPGSSKPRVMIGTYVTLLTSAEDAYQRFGPLADSFMTLVGYFSAMRELGGMRRLCDDDVRTRISRVEVGPGQSNCTYHPGMKNRWYQSLIIELTSRRKNSDIPKDLEMIALPHSDQPNNPNNSVSPDIVLATNMLSVGVDVPRLGLMAVNGQPKNTAEYIQATSRVGRSSPGLVCTVLGWSRARDLSHYETFEHYHDTFYKHVEAQSVTPFSSRALDRALPAVIVSDLRLKHEDLAADGGAQHFDKNKFGIDSNAFSDRAWKVTDDQSTSNEVRDRTEKCLTEWGQRAIETEADLSYTGKTGSRPSALITASQDPQIRYVWKVPNSLREVEPSVNLVLDEDAALVPAGAFSVRMPVSSASPAAQTASPKSQNGESK